MEKFLISLAQIFLISIPQNISIMLGIYAINKRKIDNNKFLICILISLVAVFLIRLLPISFGVHTLLSMVIIIFLCVYYVKLPINKTIMAVFITFIIITLIEIINMKILTAIYGEAGFEKIMANDLSNYIAGFPSSVALIITTFVLYKVLTRKVRRE